MTQSLSFIVADRPPAMYRIEAVAIVVSRISMNVGITTAVATNHGFTAGRLTAFTLRVAVLIRGLLRDDRRWGVNQGPLRFDRSSIKRRCGRRGWGPPAARLPRRRTRRDLAVAGRAVARRHRRAA